MYSIELIPTDTQYPPIRSRSDVFTGADLSFMNDLKSFILDEIEDGAAQLAYCGAVDSKRFKVTEETFQEVVFNGLLEVEAPSSEKSALTTQEPATPVSTQTQEVEPVSFNYEGLSGLDLQGALREQVEVINYLTALNKHIAGLAKEFLAEIPTRREQLDNAERLLTSIVSNPLLGVVKRNELGELTLTQEEIENLMAMFTNKP